MVPAADHPVALAAGFDGLAERVCCAFDDSDVSAALDEVWQQVRLLNRFMQEESPWQQAKDPQGGERLAAVLYGLAEGLRVVSVLLHPFLPEAAERLLAALGQGDRSLSVARLGAVAGGARIGELAQLFPKVEREAAPSAA